MALGSKLALPGCSSIPLSDPKVSAVLAASLKLAFLAGMWLFVFFLANVIRTDIRGRTATATVPRKQSRTKREEIAQNPISRMLTIIAGRDAGKSVPLSGDILLGRSSDATLFVDDDYASSRHARIWQDSTGGWAIQDLHSTNGTYVNGYRIEDPTRIGLEDVIRIGRTQLKLEA